MILFSLPNTFSPFFPLQVFILSLLAASALARPQFLTLHPAADVTTATTSVNSQQIGDSVLSSHHKSVENAHSSVQRSFSR